MTKQYTAPDLKLVGDAQNVVLGSLGIGVDLRGEFQGFSMEFATDVADSNS